MTNEALQEDHSGDPASENDQSQDGDVQAHAHEGDAHEGEGDAHEGDAHAHDGHVAKTAMDHYLDPGHLVEHVVDSYHFELPKALGVKFTNDSGKEVHGLEIPNLTGYTTSQPMFGSPGKSMFVGRLSKFMVLEMAAAILITVAFVWLAKKIKSGESPKGKSWNLLETFVVFIRDEVVRPAMGDKDADRFMPFLLTLFFFILVLNLLGMVPFLGSATGAMAVTAVLAVCTFFVVVGSGIKKMGLIGFLKAQVPGMDLPWFMAIILIPSIWLIEMFGLGVKHFVLAVRLFANMFAGHLVLATLVGFIGVVSGTLAAWGVTPMVILASIALGLLELFVAFLQAYVFTFLASLFIGSAQHAH